MKVLVVVGWSAYPLLMALGPSLGHVVGTAAESWGYLAADLVTKVAFGLWVSTREDGREPPHPSQRTPPARAGAEGHASLAFGR